MVSHPHPGTLHAVGDRVSVIRVDLEAFSRFLFERGPKCKERFVTVSSFCRHLNNGINDPSIGICPCVCVQ